MYSATYIRHPLKFIAPAGTSRGVLKEKDSWYILLSDVNNPSVSGIGECSLIPGLSYDDRDDFELKLEGTCELININGFSPDQKVPDFPSIQFGLETALKDLQGGGRRILFPTEFSDGRKGIPINGLIWMGSRQHMLNRVTEKIERGFRVLKMKFGAINFMDELEVLHQIRTHFDRPDLEIRLDANGAWEPEEALEKLDRLSEYHIHSIEQPIKPGRIEEMAEICRISPVEVALDEELTGVFDMQYKSALLETIKPNYIILKPGMLGGFQAAEEWIDLADSMEIGWWVTSALESNIGLNAIAQWTATLNSPYHQGLGTGQLYTNNIPSPLEIRGERLWHTREGKWDLSKIL